MLLCVYLILLMRLEKTVTNKLINNSLNVTIEYKSDIKGVFIMNIGIIGSRRRDTEADLDILIKFLSNMNMDNVTFVSGGCPKGGDKFAEQIASNLRIPIIIHYPDKSTLPVNPQRWDFARINYERNTLIARDADILVALVAFDRKGGTEDTIRKYLKMGKERLYII